MASLPNAPLSPEEYLELDRRSDRGFEYYDGEIFEIEGATRQHAIILVNVVRRLGNQLEGKPCEVYTSCMKVQVSPGGPFVYPDVVVVCGERRFADEVRDILINPTAIIEVLSPSTEGHDRGKKAELYRGLPSLRDYLTIAQDRIHVDHFERQPDNRWMLTEYCERTQSISIASICCTLALSEVYDRIE